MTKNQILQKAKRHLLRQNCKSENTNHSCRYRQESGSRTLRCAIGVFIPKHLYDLKMEGQDAEDLLDIFPQLKKHLLPSNLNERDGVLFLLALQSVHDELSPPNWAAGFKELQACSLGDLPEFLPNERLHNVEKFEE